MDERKFEAMVASTIAENPNLVAAAIRGITAGQLAALHIAQREAGEARMAMTLALVLANKRGKLPDNLIGKITDQVVKAIGQPNCDAERDFVNQRDRP
jgi:hypothetical protein